MIIRSLISSIAAAVFGAALLALSHCAWADDYVPPPQGEREAAAALKAKGAILQIDGDYRINQVVLMSNCTNDDVKLLAACERLTSLQLLSPRIDDKAIEHLKSLPKLASITISRSGISEAGLAALRAARPAVRINDLARSVSTPGGASTASRTSVSGEPADEVGVRFIASGITALTGGYQPLRAEMGDAADAVKKAPDGLEAPKYGTLKLGTGSWAFILDEPEGKPAKLFLDTNGDGDLTNDPRTTWSSRKFGELTQYSGSARIELAGGKTGTVNLYRFDPNDKARATLKNTMMFYPDYGYELTLTLDGKKFSTSVSGEAGTMPLWIDRDGNKQRSTKLETVRIGAPFNFTGTTYVLSRNNSEFKLLKASATLPMAPLPADFSVGKKAIPFQMATLDGAKIDFPKGYAGKLVMLDFWATWCGPCIAEIPNVKKAYADWHGKGFEIIGISFDNANMEEKVKTFLQEHELPWPQIYEGKGWTTTLGELYEVTAIPFVLLVDGDTGTIVATVRDLRGPGLAELVGKELAKKSSALGGSSP